MRRLLLILGLFVILCVSAPAQESDSPFALQANTQLVIRAVSVKDARGNPIEGLKGDDFVVTEDGVSQTISVFEFQKLDDSPAPLTSASGRRRGVGNTGETNYKDRRLLAIYFDLGSMQDVERTRALGAAMEFVETQMTAADLLAILTYSEGRVRWAQDFTDDRAHLLETIRALLNRDYRNQDRSGVAFGQNDGEFNIFSTDRRLMGLQTAAKTLGGVSGAKALIYFSSGVGLDVGNQAQLRATLNAAVRSNVSIYPIDSRGLSAIAPMGDASRHSPGGIAMYTGASSMDSMRHFQRSQDALYTLAADTGGKALLDSNDLVLGIRQAQREVSSYYILGYYPTNKAQDGRLRRLKISLKEHSGTLSYRAAYYAQKEFSKFTNADKERQLEDALLLQDPITELTIAIELNYFRLSGDGYFVPLAVQIPGSELVLAQQAGADRTVIDFIGEIRDESGTTVTNLRDKVEIRLTGEVPNRLASGTVQYDAGFKLRSGQYVIKILARNADTGRIGTYETTFVVPDINRENRRLPISSIVLGSQRVALTDALFDAGNDNARAPVVNPLIQDRQKLIPSISRVFSKIRPLYVYLEAYRQNTSGTETVLAFVTFYREHEKVFETPVFAVQAPPEVESRAVPVKLTIPLGGLLTGEYTCQVTVLNPAEQRVAIWRTPVSIVP